MKYAPNMHQKHSKPWFDPPTPLKGGSKIAVIGGGISGLMVASQLSKYFEVILIEEKKQLMSGASGNPAAILDPYISLSETIEKEFYLKAYEYAIEFYSSLKSDAFNQCGLTKIAKNPIELQKYAKLARQYPAPIMNLTENGLFFPKSGYIIPANLINELSNSFNTILDCKISFLKKNEEQKWTLINNQNHKIIDVDSVVLCNSYNVNSFTQTNTLTLEKLSGQISFIAPQKNIDQIYCHEGYLTPKIKTNHGSSHICGATFDRDDLFEISDQAHLKNIDKSPIPLKEPKIIGGRRAIRAMTHDHLPICGALANISDYKKLYTDLHHGPTHKKFQSAPYHQDLYISAGLGARGFLTAPLLAAHLTALIRGAKIPFSQQIHHALHPARFIIRNLSKK